MGMAGVQVGCDVRPQRQVKVREHHHAFLPPGSGRLVVTFPARLLSNRGTASRAAVRQSAGASSQGGGCAPRGAGSDGGADVSVGATHSPGGWSRSFELHHQMRVGVTSIHIRAKYQSRRRKSHFGLPLNASGVFAIESRT
jgi:hypothetical protein